MPNQEWHGHVAVVTGAGSGIELGIAERFAEASADVVLAEVNAELSPLLQLLSALQFTDRARPGARTHLSELSRPDHALGSH